MSEYPTNTFSLCQRKALLKTLNHVLTTMVGKSLRFWIPRKNCVLKPGQDMSNPVVKIELADLPVLKFVPRLHMFALAVCRLA